MSVANWVGSGWDRGGSKGRNGRRRFPLTPEVLEDRAVPAMIVVQTAADSSGGQVTGSNGMFLAPTLRAAVEFSNANPDFDTITFASAIAGQTIALTGNDSAFPTQAGGATALVITDSVSIVGDAARGITLDAGGQRRLLAIAPLSNTMMPLVTLQNLTLTGGNAVGGAGGAGFNGGGGGGGLGGAIYAYNALLNVTNCTIHGNTAQGGAGGASTFVNSDNANNYVGSGGGGSTAFAGGAGSTTDFGGGGGGGTNGSGFNGSGKSGGLGGLNSSSQQAASDADGTNGGGGGGGTTTFFRSGSGGSGASANPAGVGGGGGGAGYGNGGVGADRGGAGGFGAGGGGGGGNNQDGGGDAGNGGPGGGGGGAYGPNKAGFSSFAGGNGGLSRFGGGGGGGGAGLGGAIFQRDGVLTLTNSTITQNQVLGGAGGVGVVGPNNGGGTNLGASDPSGQAGDAQGAGVVVYHGSINITNCTIVNNVGSSGSQVVVVLKTNASPGPKLTLNNSVVAGSTVPGGPDLIVRGPRGLRPEKIAGRGNFIGRAGKLPRTLLVGRGDPGLGTLADNGGPTKTLLPKPGSRLIDAGRKSRRGLPATDQRGLPRIVGRRVDVGAVEVS